MPNMNGQVQKVEIDQFAWHETLSHALRPIRAQILKPLTDAAEAKFEFPSPPSNGWDAFWHFKPEGGTAYLEVVHRRRSKPFDNVLHDRNVLAHYSSILEAAGVEHRVYDAGEQTPCYQDARSYPMILIPALEVPPIPDLTVTIRATVVG